MTEPSRRDRMRPLEYIVIAIVVSVFMGVVVLFSTRNPTLAVVFFGIAFIVTLVGIAMLSLAVRPTAEEKLDMSEQDDEDSAH